MYGDPDSFVRGPDVPARATREITLLRLASPLLVVGAMQNKMYKVLTPITKRDGGSWFMKVGSGYTNKDNSINLYLDAVPVAIAPGKGMTLQIRELDEADMRQREVRRAGGELAAPSSTASQASEGVPF